MPPPQASEYEYDPREAHPKIPRVEKRQVLQAIKDSVVSSLGTSLYQRSLKKLSCSQEDGRW